VQGLGVATAGIGLLLFGLLLEAAAPSMVGVGFLVGLFGLALTLGGAMTIERHDARPPVP